MMEDMEKQRSQPWRLMSTCAVQFRGGPRLWKAHDLYNEGEATIKGRFRYLHYSLICLDLDLSGDISMHSYVV